MTANLNVGLIRTLAGTGEPGWSGDGAAALVACLNEPKSLTLDAEGNLFIADSENHVVRKIDGKTGCIKTVAGCIQGVGPEAAPVLPPPAAEGSSDDPFAESDSVSSHAFTQQTDLSGTVRYVVAGTAPAKRFSGDGGPAGHALLNFPTAVAVDRAGHLYIADTLNHRVRRVDAVTGVITTIAGLGLPRYSGDGGLAVEAGLNEPAALAVSDEDGLLYIADQNNNRVRAVDLTTGMIRTVAGTGTAAYNGDGMAATDTGLAGPSGLALMSDHTLVVADSFNGRIRAVDPITGFIRTIAGDGGEYKYQGPDEPPSRSLSRPSGIVLDGAGNLFFTDSDNHLVRRWDRATGRLTRIAGVGVATYGGDEGAALEAGLSYPFGIVMARTGHLFVADTFNHRIREIAL